MLLEKVTNRKKMQDAYIEEKSSLNTLVLHLAASSITLASNKIYIPYGSISNIKTNTTMGLIIIISNVKYANNECNVPIIDTMLF